MTSLDYGKTFTNIDDRIEGAIIKKTDGIFKNPLDPKRVSRIFVCLFLLNFIKSN